MPITPVQQNIETQQKTYRDAKQPIKTSNLVHPLPPQGHLVHDTLLSVPKFWMKDIAYDVKAVKDGLAGKAKDHQTGRLNDVGLKLGGIGIATYLASKTTDPRARLMEYVGLGAFLASMSLYPLLAINLPSRIVQGYDIGKEYIDDQGRKKSVLQDGNYIPFDMYRGEYVGEDLDIIGDRMGIPRNIKNRDELTKEQIRKVAIQNNTLWMLGAGFAVPVMTALTCCGLEKVLTPVMEKLRNARYNSNIAKTLKLTEKMTLKPSELDENKLSRKVEKLLLQFKDKEIPQSEIDKLVDLITDTSDDLIKQGVKEDVEKILKSEKNSFVINENMSKKIANAVVECSTGRQKTVIKDVFTLTEAEVEKALSKVGSDGKYMTDEQLYAFKDELKSLFGKKIEQQKVGKDALYMEQNNIIEAISQSIQKNKSSYVSENNLSKLVDFAKVMGEFKENDNTLFKCASFKVEYSSETVLARSYKKFENVVFDVLDIKYKDLKLMKESEQYTKEILNEKINALVKNEEKYKKAVEKLSKAMENMDLMLHGKDGRESYLKDLISAYENNYNNTAKRLNNISEGTFSGTIDKLIKEDVTKLPTEISNSIKTKDELTDLIDGVTKAFSMDNNKPEDKRLLEFAEINSKGVGSSKQMKISRIIGRIQDIKNGQYRILHALDIYKREIPSNEYQKAINEKLKDVLLGATSSNHTLKLGTDNNPQFYRDIMQTGWKDSEQMEKATSDALKNSSIKKSLEKYFERFKDVIGNNNIDFTKPDHNLGLNINNKYIPDAITRESKFNLIAQNPVEFFKKASKTRFENQKWLRIASAIGGSVIAATVLTQFCFGRIKNPHNIVIKQVSNDDTNK